jgi:hypothetical protein
LLYTNNIQGNAKKNAASATPATESDQAPPTPTPTVPVTPTNPNNPFGAANNKQQIPNGQPAPHMQAPPPQQNNGDLSDSLAPFGELPAAMDFDPSIFGDSGDALDTFDFDSFLQNDEGDTLGNFDANFAFGGDNMGIDAPN